ncbi:DEAD/DEAH box helicase [Paenibacillus sp. YYML68]|uniref:DEAD/DEAH box helicase n=1 Tax=Paenibacillus sp. YYML68 TaxID=2909250 RepID=UPI002492CFF5|nr:DEAD/DEAH box helicase [Paenibacillus sp. YYML68]
MKKNEFAALGISDNVSEQLRLYGYAEPTPIQKEAIPAILSGADCIAQAQTGTGKTLAFVLPIIETIRPEREHVQALIVTPTRELAIQITEEVQRWAPLKGLRVLSAYGGQDVERQIRKLEGNIHIIVATPGRLLDHIRRETVQLHKLSILVLDEADQMLHMGFLNEVIDIIAMTPSRRQTLLFSATMPPKIRDLAKAYMRPPVEIEIKAKRITLDEIEQVVVQTTDRGKLDALCTLIDNEQPYLAMIFCRTKLRASKLREELAERGYSCDELHGDLTQAKREQVMKRFRDAKIQLLVATDVAARGLDVEGITHVINYDIPHDVESYIHRIGRTGRAGQTGKAVTFAAPRDANYLELIERGIKSTLAKRPGKPGAALQAERGESRERTGRGESRERAGRDGRERDERSGGARNERGRGARGAAGGRGRSDRGAAPQRGRDDRGAGAGRDSRGGAAPQRGRDDRGPGAGRDSRGGAAPQRGRDDRGPGAGRDSRGGAAPQRGRDDRSAGAGRDNRGGAAPQRGRDDRGPGAGRDSRGGAAPQRGRDDRGPGAGRDSRGGAAPQRGRDDRGPSAGRDSRGGAAPQRGRDDRGPSAGRDSRGGAAPQRGRDDRGPSAGRDSRGGRGNAGARDTRSTTPRRGR